MPERLPKRFRPRDREWRPRVAWRPLGAAVALMLVLVVAAYLLVPTHPPHPIGARLRLGPTIHATTGPDPVPATVSAVPATQVPPASDRPPALPAREVQPPAVARPTPAPSGQPTPAPTSAPPSAAPTPAGGPSPTSSPSPPALCLPLLPLCV